MRPAQRLWRAWLRKRLRPADQLPLTHRNVYILPSRAGWALAVTLVVLLIASINYQLNLGYLLTFLLAGSAAASMGAAHANLRGLTLHLHPGAGGFAGQVCRFDVHLHNSSRKPRWGLGLALYPLDPAARGEKPGHPDAEPWTWLDVPAQGHSSAQLAFVAPRRGLHALPAITISTGYPLGIFRVWAVWRPASRVWIYPAPEQRPPPLPAASGQEPGRSAAAAHHGEDMDGVRAWRSGDPRKLIVWKKAARAFANGGNTAQLVSRDRPWVQNQRLWLDMRATGLVQTEARLSRLTAWVLAARDRNLTWGLRLPGHAEIAPDQGTAHATRCLQALAACPG